MFGRAFGGDGSGLFPGLQRPGGAFHQVRQIERFGQVIIGLGLGRLNRRHDGVLGRDHDHRQAGADLGDPRQHFQPVAIGHDHIGNHHIALALADPAHQRGQRGRGMHLGTGAGQRLGQDRADRAVVIGHQNCAIHQPFSLLSRSGFKRSGFGKSGGAIGNDRQKTVRPGTELTETQP